MKVRVRVRFRVRIRIRVIGLRFAIKSVITSIEVYIHTTLSGLRLGIRFKLRLGPGWNDTK